MLKSAVVDIDGRFAGAAVTAAGQDGVLFVAAHDRARPLHGRRFADLAAARDAVARRWAESPRPVEGQCTEIGAPASASSCA